MGALFSEVLNFLKVILPMQNDQRWLPLLSWFSKPPFQKCLVILQFNTAQHKTSSLICDLLAKALLYPLSVKYRAGKRPC